MKIMELFLCKKNRHKSSDKLDDAFNRLQQAIHDFLERSSNKDKTIIALPIKHAKR